jgi:hypothetical protein
VSTATRTCPGCKLEMPRGNAPYDRDFNASPECWSVYTEVLAAEYQDMLLFAEVHQLSVDAYAAQHAGAQHRDKSVCVHLVGLHLVLVEELAPIDVPPRLQRLASGMTHWPHYAPPADMGPLTVFDVATAKGRTQHAERVRAWSRQVWAAWRPQHAAVAELARRCYAERR